MLRGAYVIDEGNMFLAQLNNLVARDHYNRATGAWWLYRWYGGMTGDTVKVTPPDANAEGLQGLAALDPAKKQARILLGGCAGNVEVVIRGFAATPYWGDKVHAAVWIAEYTDLNPSDDPVLVLERELTISSGQASLTLENLDQAAAYQVILTPCKAALFSNPRCYPAAYADLSGTAAITYTDSAYVECDSGGRINFVVTAPNNGHYELKLNYFAENPCELRLGLNGSSLSNVFLPAAVPSAWSVWTMTMFLNDGINRVAFDPVGSEKICIHSLEIAPASGLVTSYEAHSSSNSVEFDGIHILQSGLYRMVVHFANAEFRGGHSYNSQVVDRRADIQVNDGSVQKVYFRNTFAWDNYQSRVVNVILQAGSNSIRFFSRDADGTIPLIDRIEIAAPF